MCVRVEGGGGAINVFLSRQHIYCTTTIHISLEKIILIILQNIVSVSRFTLQSWLEDQH